MATPPSPTDAFAFHRDGDFAGVHTPVFVGRASAGRTARRDPNTPYTPKPNLAATPCGTGTGGAFAVTTTTTRPARAAPDAARRLAVAGDTGAFSLVRGDDDDSGVALLMPPPLTTGFRQLFQPAATATPAAVERGAVRRGACEPVAVAADDDDGTAVPRPSIARRSAAAAGCARVVFAASDAAFADELQRASRATAPRRSHAVPRADDEDAAPPAAEGTDSGDDDTASGVDPIERIHGDADMPGPDTATAALPLPVADGGSDGGGWGRLAPSVPGACHPDPALAADLP